MIVATLGMIFWQDYKDRAVSWLFFPLITVLFTSFTLSLTSPYESLINIISSFAFIVVQLMTLTAYFSIKSKRLTNIAKGYLGWGDILFLISLCFLLPVVNYLFFYIFTLVVVLVREIVIYLLPGCHATKIPLAGIQAFILSIFFLANIIWTNCIPFTSNTYLLKLLSYE